MAGKSMRALKNSVLERIAEMTKSGLLEKDSDGDFWIRDCGWSDYSGSTYTRSNARSMARDYSGIVTESGSGYAHGWTGAYISKSVLNDGPAVGLFDIAERVMAVLDIVDSLADYPVYDEDDMSALAEEILFEDFESWGFRDMESEANKLAGYPDEEIELDRDSAAAAFHRAAEGYGFTATSSEVRNHAERALEIYNSVSV